MGLRVVTATYVADKIPATAADPTRCGQRERAISALKGSRPVASGSSKNRNRSLAHTAIISLAVLSACGGGAGTGGAEPEKKAVESIDTAASPKLEDYLPVAVGNVNSAADAESVVSAIVAGIQNTFDTTLSGDLDYFLDPKGMLTSIFAFRESIGDKANQPNPDAYKLGYRLNIVDPATLEIHSGNHFSVFASEEFSNDGSLSQWTCIGPFEMHAELQEVTFSSVTGEVISGSVWRISEMRQLVQADVNELNIAENLGCQN
jgi:hypothetical protein